MSKIERFEDLLIWQKARALVRDIYRITESKGFGRDYGLKDQIRRASVSIMLNTAEGFARQTNKEFGRFLFMSHGSVAEVQSILYIALDLNYVSGEEFQILYAQRDEISRMISGLIKHLNDSKNMSNQKSTP